MPLNAINLRNAKPKESPYKLYDEMGLYVVVTPSGGKLWRYDYRVDGKRKTASLGKYPTIGLADAREKRDEIRVGIKAGDRYDARPTAGKPTSTFEAVARDWFASRKVGLAKSVVLRIGNSLERDVYPTFGARPISEISPTDILLAIRKIEARGAIYRAKRTRSYVSRVFRYAIAEGKCSVNPAAELGDALLPARPVKHRAALSSAELPEFFSRLARAGETQSKLALRLLLYTAARTQEVRFAAWSEFEGLDTNEALWRVPAARMKMRLEHVVPLSKQAVTVLARIRAMKIPGTLLFAKDTRSGVISENAMISLLYDGGYSNRATVHGFRRTFSTIANESGQWNKDWIERALAHVDADQIRGTYNAAEYLPQRRNLMQWWANLLDAKEAEGFI